MTHSFARSASCALAFAVATVALPGCGVVGLLMEMYESSQSSGGDGKSGKSDEGQTKTGKKGDEEDVMSLPVGPPAEDPDVDAPDVLGPVSVSWKVAPDTKVEVKIMGGFAKDEEVFAKTLRTDAEGYLKLEVPLKPKEYQLELRAHMRHRDWEKTKNKKLWKHVYKEWVEFKVNAIDLQRKAVVPATPTAAPECSIGTGDVLDRWYSSNLGEQLLDEKGYATFDIKLPKAVEAVDWGADATVSGKLHAKQRVKIQIWENGFRGTSIEDFFNRGARADLDLGTVTAGAQKLPMKFSCTFLPKHISEKKRFAFPNETERGNPPTVAVGLSSDIKLFVGGDRPIEELDYIAVSKLHEKSLSSCNYASKSGKGHLVLRKRYDQSVRIVDRRTGQTKASKRFNAPTPKCAKEVLESRTSRSTFVDDDVIAKWVKGAVASVK